MARAFPALAVVGAVALGIRDALEPEEQQPIIAPAYDDVFLDPPPAVEVHFEPGRPEDTWVVIRPWLLPVH